MNRIKHLKQRLIDWRNSMSVWFTPRRANTILMTALVLFAIIIAIGGIILVNAVQQINQERHSRQMQINQQLGAIVCALVIGVPDEQRSATPGINRFVIQYHCPPYDPEKAKDFQPPSESGKK